MSSSTTVAEGPSGLLLVDKPEGMTSHDVVDRVRRLLGTRRVGHTGTLDPAATGLLVLCVGRAGRLQSFLTGFDKTYEGSMKFGVQTDTYDRDGVAVGDPHPDPRPDRDLLQAACTRYIGSFEQAPPPFSAKKFEGKKFYEMARKGEPVPHLPKTVRVARFEMNTLDGANGTFLVECSSGTYIRSLVHDIGQELGFGAHLSALRRTTVGPFLLEQASTLQTLEALETTARTVPPSWMSLGEIPLPFPSVSLSPAEVAKVRRGHAVPLKASPEALLAPWVRLVSDDELIALGHLEPLGRGALALARPKIVLKD